MALKIQSLGTCIGSVLVRAVYGNGKKRMLEQIPHILNQSRKRKDEIGVPQSSSKRAHPQ
jgi:hypothetical protein